MIRLVFEIIRNKIKIYSEKRKWLKNNTHNFTSMGKMFNGSLVKVGNGTYGRLNVINFSDKYRLTIGNYCSIATDVYFVVCGEHRTELISTYPFRVQYCGHEFEAASKGDIVVDDDVWFGHSTTILSGVHIGQGAVIAAGAVVTKDVPPYAIVAGNPARIIRYRFGEELVEQLLKIDYSSLSPNMIREHEKELYTKLEDENQIDWMPRKN